MRIFLVIAIFLATVVTADTVNILHVKMPTSNNVVKVYGELLDKTPVSCKSGIAISFTKKEGFMESVYMGADVGFQDLKSVKFMQIYRPGDTEIVFCVPEEIFESDASFNFQASIAESIFLWQKKEDAVIEDIPLAKGYMKDLETNSSVATKESVVTDPIFWLLVMILAVLVVYEYKNYKERRRKMRK